MPIRNFGSEARAGLEELGQDLAVAVLFAPERSKEVREAVPEPAAELGPPTGRLGKCIC